MRQSSSLKLVTVIIKRRYFAILGQSQSENRQNTPSPLHHDDSRGSSGNSSPVNHQPKIQQEPESWSAYIRRLAVGPHPAPTKEPKHQPKPKPTLPATSSQNSSSMFFYDNLSSLRATKKPFEEDLEQLRKAPGTRIWPIKDRHSKSELDPSSKEFIPKSQRRVRMPFRGRDEPVWPESRKTETINPPPGLKKFADIWSFENAGIRDTHQREHGWNSFRDDTLKADLASKLRNRPFTSERYSVLMPQQDAEKPRHSEVCFIFSFQSRFMG